ncbi:hypothetical protein RRG08_006769 [Elysia crispata]|uniref:Uncharacterized protein n=1 Tax=Elysia crispata TaxID=231223 RepID=A0AAE0YB56_9GAST|nr:hypothetical protein RRG08_006769 [Elysia crispata]
MSTVSEGYSSQNVASHLLLATGSSRGGKRSPSSDAGLLFVSSRGEYKPQGPCLMTRTNDAWPRSCDFASHKRRQSYKNVKSLSELSTLHGTLLVLLKDVVSGKRKAWRSLRSFYSDAQVRGRDESQDGLISAVGASFHSLEERHVNDCCCHTSQAHSPGPGAVCKLSATTIDVSDERKKKSWSQKRTGVQADSKPRLVFTAEVSSRIRVENHTGIDQKDIQHGIGRIPAIIVWIDGL